MRIRLEQTVNGQPQVSVVTDQGFREAFPNTLFPEVLTDEVVGPFGGAIVVETTQPIAAFNQTITEGALQQINGKWQATWVVAEMPSEEATVALANIQTFTWIAIKNERDRRLLSVGVPVTVNGVEKGFETDVINRTRYAQMVDAGKAQLAAGGTITDVVKTPDGQDITWKTMDNSFVEMTIQLVNDIVAAISNQEQTVFAHAEALRVQMMALSDPTTFNVMQGWPDVYSVQGLP